MGEIIRKIKNMRFGVPTFRGSRVFMKSSEVAQNLKNKIKPKWKRRY